MRTLLHKSGVVEIYEEKLVVKKKGSLFAMRSGSEKTFYFEQIRSIEKNRKRPFYDDAFIQIEVGGSGGGKQGGSLLDNAIPFSSNEEMDAAYAILEQHFANFRKHSAKASSHGISAADEIKKYKALLDDGIISQAEFDAKKEELLGL